MIERWLMMEGLVGGEALVGGGPLGAAFPVTPPSPPSQSPQDRFLSDIWVYVTLALMAVSCVGCLCSCLLYHKFQQWKHHAETSGELGSTVSSEMESRRDPEEESLPSYTLVTGLPTYEQAIEQLKEAKKLSTLSVANLLDSYSPPDKS